MSSIKFNTKETNTIIKALLNRKRDFETLDEEQYFKQNCDKESKDIDKILKKITKQYSYD
tara:strand:+ start:122 stop:301 length:180 start_codon:yes stop_codon:yes gene_type:complete